MCALTQVQRSCCRTCLHRGGWKERRRREGGEEQGKEGEEEKIKSTDLKEEESVSQGEPHCGVRILREVEVKAKITDVELQRRRCTLVFLRQNATVLLRLTLNSWANYSSYSHAS